MSNVVVQFIYYKMLYPCNCCDLKAQTKVCQKDVEILVGKKRKARGRGE